jgi:hypothetical protein
MTWKDLELLFNRALRFTFSRKKLLFMAPILLSCGILVVLCKAMAFNACDWVRMSLQFLPLFFCSVILITSGVVLIRIYHDEVKGLCIAYRKTIRSSLELMIQVAYLCMPLILGYILLWTVLGVFYLLRELPFIGDFLGVVLSFGPFLLLLGSFLLSVLAVKMLFYLTPAVALRSSAQVQILEDVLNRFVSNPFTNSALFIMALLPWTLVSLLMTLAAVMTENTYMAIDSRVVGGMDLFFIMLPFSLLLSPAVIFFFNFAAESYVWVQRQLKERSAP